MATTRRSTIYLDPELHRRLRRISAEDDRTVSEMVNEAVAAYLDAGAPAAALPSATGVTGATGATGSTAAAHRADDATAATAATTATAGAAGAAAAGDRAAVSMVASVAALPPGWSAPTATVPDGLAPPVRRLFGVARVGDPESVLARAVAAARAGA